MPRLPQQVSAGELRVGLHISLLLSLYEVYTCLTMLSKEMQSALEQIVLLLFFPFLYKPERSVKVSNFFYNIMQSSARGDPKPEPEKKAAKYK